MVVVYLLVALAIAFAIAAVVIGREARRMDAEPPKAVFDPDEAVEWVANHLPFEVSAVLSHDDVRRILAWNLQYFKLKGLSANGSTVYVTTPSIVQTSEAVAFVLDQAESEDADFSVEQVTAVLEAQFSYLEVIGAIGPAADPENL
ncbi:MAG TPA: hypothetical protein VHN98_07370 [Acidimicrobiales bacterium]|nr:hypothetical protein [Acidimicrobiales bacterium]